MEVLGFVEAWRAFETGGLKMPRGIGGQVTLHSRGLGGLGAWEALTGLEVWDTLDTRGNLDTWEALDTLETLNV